MAQLSHNAAATVAKITQRLGGEGWKVRVSRLTDEDITVTVIHKLSCESGVGFRNDGGDHDQFVERFLDKREFAMIEDRPRACPHESLIGRIRSAAAANQFDPVVVEVMARILGSEKLLTHEEALWLERAGPAWSG